MYRLYDYLETNGILLCNANPYLPSLEDIGCSQFDAAELINMHMLFYCKAFKNRTVYLSQKVYYLLKAVRPKRPLTPEAEVLYSLLEEVPGSDTRFLKRVCTMSGREFSRAFNLLFQDLYITAIGCGDAFSGNWSVYWYATAEEWENCTPIYLAHADPEARLREILSRTMTEEQIRALIRR